jgi:hypothetical protein
MKELKTIQGETLLVDDEDYEKAKEYRWTAFTNNGSCKVITCHKSPDKSWKSNITYKKLILGLDSKKMLFKNDNPLDFRRENIMLFDTKGERIRFINLKRDFPNLTIEDLTEKFNKIKLTDKTKASKYIGVCLDKSIYSNARKWFAYFKYQGKSCNLGYYYAEEEAARAYDATVIELYGKDVKRNFPDLTLEELLEIDNIKAEDRISFFDRLAKRPTKKPPKILKQSQYIGVYASNGKKNWKSIIFYQDKQSYLGNFDAEEDAAKAYDERALDLYGEDAKLNFPRSNYNYTKGLKTFCGKTILYDEEDYEKAKQYRWTINTWNGRSRVITTFWNREKNRNDWISYKELILGIKSKWTLYKNDNPMDLRRENIWVFDTKNECSSAMGKIYQKKNPEFDINKSKMSQRCIKIYENRKTNYYGIAYNPKAQRNWAASIVHNKKGYTLGNYTKAEYAAMAYDLKALEIYGTESKRNFSILTMQELKEMLAEIKVNDELFSYEVRSKSLQGKRPPKIEKTSMYVGVSLTHPKARGRKWFACIARYTIRYRLGYFYTEEEAARAYDKKALELYGENAKLNFPQK